MDEIKLDKGIPLPSRARLTKYPWAIMEVGDSFAVPGTTSARAGQLAAHASKRQKPKKFVHGKHAGEYRVWRSE